MTRWPWIRRTSAPIRPARPHLPIALEGEDGLWTVHRGDVRPWPGEADGFSTSAPRIATFERRSYEHYLDSEKTVSLRTVLTYAAPRRRSWRRAGDDTPAQNTLQDVYHELAVDGLDWTVHIEHGAVDVRHRFHPARQGQPVALAGEAQAWAMLAAAARTPAGEAARAPAPGPIPDMKTSVAELRDARERARTPMVGPGGVPVMPHLPADDLGSLVWNGRMVRTGQSVWEVSAGQKLYQLGTPPHSVPTCAPYPRGVTAECHWGVTAMVKHLGQDENIRPAYDTTVEAGLVVQRARFSAIDAEVVITAGRCTLIGAGGEVITADVPLDHEDRPWQLLLNHALELALGGTENVEVWKLLRSAQGEEVNLQLSINMLRARLQEGVRPH